MRMIAHRKDLSEDYDKRDDFLAEEDMETNGDTYAAVVSYLAANGEPTKDNTHGAIAENNYGH